MARNILGIKSSLWSQILCKPPNFLSSKLFTCMILVKAIWDWSIAQGVVHRYKVRTFCNGFLSWILLRISEMGLSHPSGPLSTIIKFPLRLLMHQTHEEVKTIVTSYTVEQKKSRISSCACNSGSNRPFSLQNDEQTNDILLSLGLQLNDNRFAH